MKEMEFIPLEMVDGVTFGETRDKVRVKFGQAYKEFKKSRFSKNTADAYEFFHVYYTDNDLFEALEVFPEAKLKTKDGFVLNEYSQSLVWLKSLDSETEVNNDGATSYELGISIYAPDEKIESIIIAEKDYYKK